MSEPPQPPSSRRLAAIMFTDIVGYSALTQRNESAALRLLTEHNILIRAALVAHAGREIKTVGDAFLAEFNSALEAARCAIRIQRDIDNRNNARDDIPIEVRIGIHLGDVVYRENDVFGDGVNIAARVQSTAGSGEIRLSEDVARQIGNKIEYPLIDLGPIALKNIVQEIRIFLVQLPWSVNAAGSEAPSVGPSGGVPAATAAKSRWNRKPIVATVAAFTIAAVTIAGYLLTPLKKPERTVEISPTAGTITPLSAINPLSVMVMPFANQTGDNEKAYIADALTSNITSDLTRIQDAFIVPAATAFSLADKKLTVPQLGKEAAVRFILTGSVTGDKEKLRINAVLSDTQTGAQLWTESFDGKQSDLFALKDQVTTRIGSSIGPKMIIVAARESEKRANKPQVADLLMRASALGLNQQSLVNHQAMEALYRETLALEPNNLTAKIGLAISLSFQAANFERQLKLDRPARVALAKQATDLAQEVLRADPTSGEAYLCIGIFASLTGDLESAVQAGRRLVELQPKNSAAFSVLGHWLFDIGEMQQAKVVLEKSLQFASPARRPAETYAHLARVAFVQDRTDEAITLAQQSIDANPRFGTNHETLALAYARRGDLVRARKAAAEAVRLFPNLQLDIKNRTPWPGKEAAYRKYIETQYLPAWRLAGLPE